MIYDTVCRKVSGLPPENPFLMTGLITHRLGGEDVSCLTRSNFCLIDIDIQTNLNDFQDEVRAYILSFSLSWISLRVGRW